jgi:hypothetical protein
MFSWFVSVQDKVRLTIRSYFVRLPLFTKYTRALTAIYMDGWLSVSDLSLLPESMLPLNYGHET